MTVCALCGKEELAFVCPYCKSSFCAEHRLPEAHGCPGLALAREEARARASEQFQGRRSQPVERYVEMPWYTSRPPRPSRETRRVRNRGARFSPTEVRDLLIALLLVVLVSISVMGGPPGGVLSGIAMLILFSRAGYGWYPFSIIAVFLISFLTHELAHKFVAQRYGMWSEFRMLPQGYILSVIAIALSIPVFGTGAVFTAADSTSPQKFAKSTLAGPLSNLILGVCAMVIGVILALTGLAGTEPLYMIVLYAATLNGMLGLFNLIPVRPLDGSTVYAWNRGVWMLVVLPLFVIVGWGYLQMFI